MKSIIFTICLCFTGVGFIYSQDYRIPWTENRSLVWEDFKGEPDINVHFNASTNSGIGFSWSYKSDAAGDDFQYEISNFFDPQESWVKPGSESEHLLKHEQLHFDISELHARRLRKSVSEYSISKNIKEDLNRLYKQSEQRRQQMQKRFDQETRHSINKEAQMKWEGHIKKELKKLEAYAT